MVEVMNFPISDEDFKEWSSWDCTADALHGHFEAVKIDGTWVDVANEGVRVWNAMDLLGFEVEGWTVIDDLFSAVAAESFHKCVLALSKMRDAPYLLEALKIDD